MDTFEIATTLCRLAENQDPDTIRDCENAIFFIKTAAENKYSFDYWRTFWKILKNLAEKEDMR